MKVVKANQTRKFENSPACFGDEYPLGDKDVNTAVIDIKGRYPDKGRSVNLKCKEIAHVLSGSVLLEVEGKKVKLEKGDEVLIMPKEKFYWQGNCTIFMVCNPAFDPKQYKMVA